MCTYTGSPIHLELASMADPKFVGIILDQVCIISIDKVLPTYEILLLLYLQSFVLLVARLTLVFSSHMLVVMAACSL